MKRISVFLIPLVGLAASLIVGTTTHAAPTGGQALEISPPLVNLSANPGQTITTQIDLRNISNGPLIIDNQLNDFTAKGETGTPQINTDPNAPIGPYSIRTWVRPIPEMELQPQKIQKLTVTIHVPASAAPGGYYGVLRFTGTPPELKGSGVSLSASLGSLIFIKVNGQAKEGLSIAEFSVNDGGKAGSLFESTPINFVERFENTGNIFEQPIGNITITDMFGKKVANVNVNLEGRDVLPGSVRKFTQPLDSSVIGNRKLFGHYTATLNIKYGTGGKSLSQSTSFWVIPYKLIAGGIIILLVAFFLFRFLIRRYNRHIIAQSSKRR